MKTITIALTTCFFLLSYVGQAQELLQGKVTAFKGFPINNVSVAAKKSKDATITDSLGYFQIRVKENDVLKIKADGFENSSVKYKDQNQLAHNIIYINDSQSYKQVLMAGHMDKKNLDYCIENLLDENNNYDKMANIFQIIQQVYPPAKIEDLRGVTSVFLNSRGAQSISSDSNALLVVDGVVQQSISSIQPRQVKSVKVLVGLEAANYGTRGGNGVVEIYLKND